MVQPPTSSAFADPGTPEASYGLEELLAIAGEQLGEEITPRTVRLYATEGLIDRPGKDGRRAVYGQRHLLQLLLVRSLARRGLSLSAIAPLVVCSDQDLQEQLQQLDDGTPALNPPEPTNEALAYLQSIQSSAAPSADQSPSSLLPLLGSPLSSRSPSSLRSSRTGSRSSASSSRWHRFSLAPGVEVHLSESASIPPRGSRREAWLQRLIDRLREQLDQQD
ncbi:MAG: MerR family transcriptional regulator [Synechococcus sp.]|jgi:DNA-binding transcriptional MerR regulator